jgi:hypothetical protein
VDSEPFILRDTLAAPLAGRSRAEEMIARSHDDTERRTADRTGDGLEQYVVLGAGLAPSPAVASDRASRSDRLRAPEHCGPIVIHWRLSTFLFCGIIIFSICSLSYREIRWRTKPDRVDGRRGACGAPDR